MDKLFTVAGYSFYNGKYNIRIATGKPSVRRSVLKFHGHTDINLQVLPAPLTAGQIEKFFQEGLGSKLMLPKRETIKKVEEKALEVDYIATLFKAVSEAAAAKTEADAKQEQAKRDARNARKRELRAEKKRRKEMADETVEG